MADFVFNVARGRVRTYYDNVDNNSPANSALVVVPLEAAGLEADATLRDYDNLSTLLAGSSNEQTTLGRKTFTDADLVASAADDTNDRLDLDIPDPTWAGGTGNPLGALIVCYDPDTTGGTDADLVPLTKHDFTVTPDGTDIVGQISATGFYRSQS